MGHNNPPLEVIVIIDGPHPKVVQNPLPHPEPPVPRQRAERPKEDFGTLYYLDDILERLDDYHEMSKKLRSIDPETYRTYQRLGATIVGKRSRFYPVMPPSWCNGSPRPALGMMHICKNDQVSRNDHIQPGDKYRDLADIEFCYFTKLNRRFKPGVQATNGDLYKVTFLYSDRKAARKIVIAGEFYAGVMADGSLAVLLERHTHRVTVGKGRKRVTFPQQKWEAPFYLEVIAADWRKRLPEEKNATAGDVAHFMVTWLAAVLEGSGGGFQIRATRNGISAVFGIDIKRSAYFFRDRDPIVVDGITKKIFHFVRPFERALPNGEVTYVRAHFRGLREFEWNGHHIVITMPGLHHKTLAEFHAEAMEMEPGEIPLPNTIDRHIITANMASHMERPLVNNMETLVKR
jgi:hypothetical protein